MFISPSFGKFLFEAGRSRLFEAGEYNPDVIFIRTNEGNYHSLINVLGEIH